MASAPVAERGLQLGPFAPRAGYLLLTGLLAPGCPERIEVQGEILPLGQDPGGADWHASSRNLSRCYLVGQRLSRHGFRIGGTQQMRGRAGEVPSLKETAVSRNGDEDPCPAAQLLGSSYPK